MNTFEENIINIYKEEGKAWLLELPTTIEKLSVEYNLSDIQTMSNLSFNYVVSAKQEGADVILKLGLNAKALEKEARCLSLYHGEGAVKLLARADGMILMQKADPGVTLKSQLAIDSEETVTITCQLIEKLHTASIPDDNNFYDLESLLAPIDQDNMLPAELIKTARDLKKELLLSTEKKVLLHGDLHHENILQHQNDWLAIDPKGFIGDPVFEVAAFLANPSPELISFPEATQLLQTRIKLFSTSMKVSGKRIHDWFYVKTVLCWIWCLEDNLDPSYFKKILELLQHEI